MELKKDHLNRLALRMKNGDPRAAAELYDELAGKIFGFCFIRVGTRETAEDLTQEIFLKLLDKIESFEEQKGSFVAWLWRLARNTVIDHYRTKTAPTFSDIGDEAAEEASVSEPHAHLDDKMEYERLKSLLSSFSEDEKNIFELRFVSELSYGEISEMLGKSEVALRVMATRLKQKIKNNFKK